MKWTLSQLQKYRSKEFPIDEMVNADEIMKIDPTIQTGFTDAYYR